jgi:phage terminase small subunit
MLMNAEECDDWQPPLTPKQRRFVAEYLIDLNATQAAIRTGYSRKTAHNQGWRLLQSATIKAAVAASTRPTAQVAVCPRCG